MKITDENICWAVEQLTAFGEFKFFPKTDLGIEMRAKAFLRLVHNKPIRQIMEEASAQSVRSGGLPFVVDWAKKGIEDPGQNDAEWILNLVAEKLDYFPLPTQMRSLYEAKLPPASTYAGMEVAE